MITNLLACASSVCIGRSPSPWTCTYRADPLSIWALHTGTRLKYTHTQERTYALVQTTAQNLHAHTLTFDKNREVGGKRRTPAELFMGLRYILWGWAIQAPVHHKRRHTLIGSKNMTTHLQTRSKGCLWPWRAVERELHRRREKKKKKKREANSRHRDLPAAWLHPGWSLNKAVVGRQKGWGRSPPCLILSQNPWATLHLHRKKRDSLFLGDDELGHSCKSEV